LSRKAFTASSCRSARNLVNCSIVTRMPVADGAQRCALRRWLAFDGAGDERVASGCVHGGLAAKVSGITVAAVIGVAARICKAAARAARPDTRQAQGIKVMGPKESSRSRGRATPSTSIRVQGRSAGAGFRCRVRPIQAVRALRRTGAAASGQQDQLAGTRDGLCSDATKRASLASFPGPRAA